MQISDLEVLKVLAEELNMRKASERLFVSQPALSQRLQSIELKWGTKIFLRSQKGLTITSTGEKIIKFATDTLENHLNLQEELVSIGTEVHGTLKLAVASIIGLYWLPNVLKRFVEKYPHVKISLVTGWSSEVIRHLYDEHYHIGIIRGSAEWKGKKQRLFSDHLYLVDTTIKSIEELGNTNKPFIQFKSLSNYYQEIQDWWYRQFPTPPKRTIIVDQIETCKQMAIHGIGYAILPEISLTAKDPKVYKIPLVSEDGQPLSRDTWIIRNETSEQLKQVAAFLEIVNELYPEIN
jgi:DNA-binding transcriptional LysR family regulator